MFHKSVTKTHICLLGFRRHYSQTLQRKALKYIHYEISLLDKQGLLNFFGGKMTTFVYCLFPSVTQQRFAGAKRKGNQTQTQMRVDKSLQESILI